MTKQAGTELLAHLQGLPIQELNVPPYVVQHIMFRASVTVILILSGPKTK